jgi:hypothetical protein
MEISFTTARSSAAVKELSVSTSPALLSHICVNNTGAGTQYFMLFDATSLPSNGTTPLISWQVAAGADVHSSLSGLGILFPTGCYAAMSSTAATLTLTATSDAIICVVYAN